VSEDKSLYTLRNLQSGENEDGHLYHVISKEHIDEVEKSWKPVLQSHLSDLKEKHQFDTDAFDAQKFTDEAGKLNIQDAHWRWEKKYELFSTQIGYSSCALVCDGNIQGLGVFDITEKYKSRIITEKKTGVVYIEYIATAPWNRKQINNQMYGGIGLALVTHAINVSFDEGMEGRIGLHSLPQAEGFYKNVCNMEDFGIDADKNMRYFEMSHEQAADWL